MVSYDIDHYPNAFGVSSGDESLQFISRTEVAVNCVPIASPVPVIAPSGVINDWTDPYSIETHPGDVVDVVLKTFKSSTAVV